LHPFILEKFVLQGLMTLNTTSDAMYQMSSDDVSTYICVQMHAKESSELSIGAGGALLGG
jgi:hypothetical protein